MASLNENTFGERTRFVLTLMDGAAVTTTSGWQWVGGFQPVTLSIEGDFTGSVQLYGSLRPGGSGPTPTAPTGAAANFPILLPVAVTTPQIIELPNSVWWVRAVFTADDANTGTCSAYAALGETALLAVVAVIWLLAQWAKLVLIIAIVLVGTVFGATNIVKMPSGINWSKYGLETGPVNCHTLDPNAPDGTTEYCSPVDGGPGCIAGSDPCACATAGTSDTKDVFAYRDHGRWRCDTSGQCTQCSDFADCMSTACSAQLGDNCTSTAQCCEGLCQFGVCRTSGVCTAQLGDVCIQTADCCEGLCLGGTCQACGCATSTTATPTTTTTSTTAGGPTTTSTSSSTTTSTSTSLPPSGAPAIFPGLPGSVMHDTPLAGVMACGVLRVVSGITATHLSGVFQGAGGGGHCAVAIYQDDDAGGLVTSVASDCPTAGGLSGVVSSFTLAAGSAYRFCVCSDSSSKYLALNQPVMTLFADAFSIAVGTSTTACDGSTAAPPATTGAINSQVGVVNPIDLPLVSVE